MPKRLNLPDVRDGPTHRERIERWCLRELQNEHGDRQFATGLLYVNVVEHTNISVEKMKSILGGSAGVNYGVNYHEALGCWQPRRRLCFSICDIRIEPGSRR